MEIDQTERFADFNGVEAELIDHSPVIESRVHPNEASENLSNEVVELRSSCGSNVNLYSVISLRNTEKKTADSEVYTNGELLEPSLELAPPPIPAASTTFSGALSHQSEGVAVAVAVEPQPPPQAGDSLQPQQENPQPSRSTPLHQEQVELGSSAESNESFLLHHGSSNHNILTFDGRVSPLGNASTQQQQRSEFFIPQLPEIDQAYPATMDENLNLPHIGDSGTDSFYLENGVISDQQNHYDGQTETSLNNEQLNQQVVSAVPASPFSGYPFAQNFPSSNLNQNQQQLLYPTSFPLASAGMEFLKPVNYQINQLPNNWFTNYQNDSYNGLLTPSGPQTNQLAAASSFDPQSSNFLLPKPYFPVRPNLQRLSQVPGMPNGINSQFPYNVQLEQSPMPMQLMPQYYPQQQYQVPAAPNTFLDPQAFRTEGWTNNPLEFNRVPMTSDRLVRDRPQEFMSETARPVASYLSPGSSLSSQVLNSLSIPEKMGCDSGLSAPHQIRTTSNNHNEQGFLGQQGNVMRMSFEVGESSSSSVKRFRREPVIAEACNQNEQSTYQSWQSDGALNLPPLWAIKNSLYDPIFEGIGLPLDPHLRLFAAN